MLAADVHRARRSQFDARVDVREADAAVEIRGVDAAGHVPDLRSTDEHLHARHRQSFGVEAHALEFLRGAVCAGGLHGAAADERLGFGHNPAQARCDRVDVIAQFVTVEGKTRLHTQGVARSEPAWHHARREERVPQPERVRGGADQLEAVLARVARAGGEARDTPDLHVVQPEHRPVAQRVRLVAQAREDLDGLRPLHGDHRGGVRLVRDLHVKGVLRPDPRHVLRVVGGVDHHAEDTLRHAVHDDVVHQSPRVVGQQRVLAAPVPELRYVVGGDPLQELERARAAEPQARHVAHVEHPRAFAHRTGLGDHAGVLHGHLVAGEGDHAAPGGHVRVVKRSSKDRVGRHGASISIAPEHLVHDRASIRQSGDRRPFGRMTFWVAFRAARRGKPGLSGRSATPWSPASDVTPRIAWTASSAAAVARSWWARTWRRP